MTAVEQRSSAIPAQPRPIERRRAKPNVSRWLHNLIAAVVVVVLGFPVYWFVSTAFKPGNKALRYTPQWFPWPPTLQNLTAAVHKDYFLSSLRNSAFTVILVVVMALLLAFLSAVAVARFRFTGRATFIILVLGIQMVPVAGLLIPLVKTLAKLHLLNAVPGLALAYLTFVLPFTVYTLRGFIINIPRELEEAAMVDGCSQLGAFFRITLPLIAPGLVATSVFAFVQAWNDFILANVIMTSNSRMTATVWLSFFTNRQGTSYPQLMAGSLIVAAPVVIFFLVLQKKLVSGMTAGAVKG